MAMYHGGIAHRGRYTSYGNDNYISLSPQLERLVERNGLHAFITMDSSGQAYLNVQGTRGLATSPAKQYKISQQQMAKLMRGDSNGTLSQNQKAYNTFNSIIKNDFIPPENYVIARNSGINRYGENMISPVNFGQIGIPVVRRPYGFTEYMGMRTDGKRRPGEAAAVRELDNGMMPPTAGYVWRGNTQPHRAQPVEQQIDIKPQQIVRQAAPRPERGQAVALIVKGEGQTAGNDTWQMLKECLTSHGIDIREKTNQQGQKEYQMVVKPLNAKKNFLYHLTEEEYRLLTQDHYNDPEYPALSIDKRLEVINDKIKNDFNEPITKDMLKTKDYVDLTYKPGMRERYEADFIAYEKRIQQKQIDDVVLAEIKENIGRDMQRIAKDPNAVDGRRITEIMANAGDGEKAFYQNSNNGRQLFVSEIRVDRTEGEKPTYWMSANINGDWQQKVISEKDYNRFRDLDDAHKLKMFTDTYKDVKIADGVDDSLAIIRGRDGNLQLKHGENITESQRSNVNLSILQNMNKAFYAEGKGGREKNVEAIQVFEVDKAHLQEIEKNLPDSPENRQLLKDLKKQASETDKLHVIAAVIDGTVVQHAMTSKDYNKFMKSDDTQRLKIADKLFDEFKVKLTPEGKAEKAQKTKNTIFGVLGAIAGVAMTGLAVKHDIDRINHRHGGPHGRPGYINPNLPPAPHPHGCWADAGITKYEVLIQNTKEAIESVGRKI